MKYTLFSAASSNLVKVCKRIIEAEKIYFKGRKFHKRNFHEPKCSRNLGNKPCEWPIKGKFLGNFHRSRKKMLGCKGKKVL